VYLLAGTLDSLKTDPRSKGVSNFHIERALGIMQRQVFSDLSVADLARRLGLDPSYFIRLSRQTIKLSPKQYMIKLKIEAGASMLISSPRPIYEIADLLHFSSEFHFSRAFKQHTSLPPRTYREVHKQVTPDVL